MSVLSEEQYIKLARKHKVLSDGYVYPEDVETIASFASAVADAAVAADRASGGEPVGEVVTIGGYPDDSEHRVKWLVKFKELKNGDLLYTRPHHAEDKL